MATRSEAMKGNQNALKRFLNKIDHDATRGTAAVAAGMGAYALAKNAPRIAKSALTKQEYKTAAKEALSAAAKGVFVGATKFGDHGAAIGVATGLTAAYLLKKRKNHGN